MPPEFFAGSSPSGGNCGRRDMRAPAELRTGFAWDFRARPYSRIQKLVATRMFISVANAGASLSIASISRFASSNFPTS